ncbi:MAG: methionyl-tRNA formyltransferase [Omnitrophica WOR_2 bacterium RBG_13_41_10]|nr:MAG: methionyl-tRNA formyltransferase [Omnitrophica WOR_2 bacterium RBG_13_41_10]
MNIAFFGSAKFAVPALKALAGLYNVSCVVTQPDKQKGRGLTLEHTAVKDQALELKLKTYQPVKINHAEAIAFFKKLKPDLFVVAAYGQILSQEVLDIPQIFSLNAHASLLPKYRGAAPINWAIINGDTKTGLSIIKMEKAMDSGPIILQKEINISQADTAISLEGKLADIAARLLLEAIHSIEKRNYILKPQDDKNITFAPKLKKEDGQINWEKSAIDIFNLIKGVLPWPGAFTYYNDKLLKIYRSQLARALGRGDAGEPGQIIQVSKEGIIVETGKDNLIIEELQIEGKRRMPAEEFIAGHRISPGDRLGYPEKKIA